MPQEQHIKTANMPVVARIVAAVIGLSFFLIGVLLVFTLRPLSWEAGLYIIISFGIAFDLLSGSFRGRWPVAALLWFVPK